MDLKYRICIDDFDKIPMHSLYCKTPHSNTAAGGGFQTLQKNHRVFGSCHELHDLTLFCCNYSAIFETGYRWRKSS
ncbi:MAG: hypothetical protein ACT6FF_09410, partial [Methanosarcinaceae archaeon]